MSAVLTHTMGRIWYVPSLSASTKEKSLSPKTYQKQSGHNFNYPNGELQFWLILNTELERDWLPSFSHIFYCLNSRVAWTGYSQQVTTWSTSHFEPLWWKAFHRGFCGFASLKGWGLSDLGMWKKPNKYLPINPNSQPSPKILPASYCMQEDMLQLSRCGKACSWREEANTKTWRVLSWHSKPKATLVLKAFASLANDICEIYSQMHHKNIKLILF